MGCMITWKRVKGRNRIAAARDRAGKDIGHIRTIKSATGEVLMKDEYIRERWGQYFSWLMNEENPRMETEDRAPKPGHDEHDVQECKNDRGIKLLTQTFKIWEKVVDRRLIECTEIHESQFGFMPGRSTTDAIFILKQTIEKHREGQKDIRVTFIDIEKAYDRVPREEIWRCMRECNVPEKYVKLIQDMYRGCQTKVRSAAGESGSFNGDVGLQQGSALSPYLFLILTDVLTYGVRKEVPESMMFADDIVLCGGREVDMTEYLDTWRKSLEERGMRISRPKTQYMDFNFERNQQGNR